MHKSFPGTTLTVVLERPADEQELGVISKALSLLEPYITGMSGDDSIGRVMQLERSGAAVHSPGIRMEDLTAVQRERLYRQQ